MGKREQLLGIMEDAAKGETKATLRARIAALEAQLAERVKVKPLEWSEAMVGRWVGETEGFPFRYTVRINLKGHIRIKTFGLYEVFNGTLDEAFAYVQADHERLIHSALEATPPAPKDPWPVHYANTTAPGRFAPSAPKVTDADMDDAAVAALVALARHNIPTDIQELLVRGDPMRSIPPGALSKSFAAALKTLTAAQKAGKP